MLKSIFKKILRRSGYEVRKISTAPDSFPDTMESGIRRSRLWDVSPQTVIDVGAASGTWTEKALLYWPNAHYLLCEPLLERKEDLHHLQLKYPNQRIEIIPKLIGENVQKVAFTVSDDLDGSGVYQKEGPNIREVESISMDELTATFHTQAPFVIKLDTHGYEIPILRGATETLKKTDLLIIEVYGFYVAPTAVLFWELCQYLDKLGFRLIDMVDILRRKHDEAFWQCDMFFIPKNSSVFKSNSYQ